MSSLQNEDGGLLTTLVDVPRGLTEAEADIFLQTGELPDFTAPPLSVSEDTEGAGFTPDEALAFLAGFPILAAGGPGAPAEIVFKFDPNQKRDAHGRWTDEGGGAEGIGIGTPVTKQLTKDELIARSKRVKQVVNEAKQKFATQKLHTLAYDVWTPERDAIHRQIVDEVYARYANVPNEGKAIISGGPSGAGKTSTLRSSVGIGADDYMKVDPDDFKEELAKRGLIPEIPGGDDLSPMERSTLVHVESMRLARMLAKRAYADRKNIIWDITMTDFNATSSHIKALRDNGYSHVAAVFVHVGPQTSRARVRARYAQGVRDWLNGKGQGGRYIPSAVLADQYDAGGRSWSSQTFDSLRDDFDAWARYSNDVDDEPPKLMRQMGEIAGA